MVGAPGIYAETSWLSATSEVIIVSNFAFSDGSMPGGLTKNKLKSRTGQSEYEEPVIGCLLCGVELPNTLAEAAPKGECRASTLAG